MPGAINFYLDKPEKVSGRSLIKLWFRFNGRTLAFSFGQNVDPKQWSLNKQRLKNNRITTKDGQFSLNDLLDSLERECLTAYHNALKTGIPAPETLRKHLSDFINQNHNPEKGPSLFGLIERFENNEIHHKGKQKATETLKKYVTVKNHLQEYEKAKGIKLDFESITLDFYHNYISYLKKKGLKQNTIAKDIQVIKTFMGEAVDLGYTANLQFRNRKFSATWEEVDNVYLEEKEVISLFNHDLSGRKKLEQVRDLFVFGCFTGLRFSDYSNVKPENIIREDDTLFIKMKTQKTGEQVIIPCHPIIIQIFEKYKDNPNRLPKSLSNQKFNEYIKEACKVSKMNGKGRLIDNPDAELWQHISSHTARRSFATNLYLQGFPNIEIMKITGHVTEKAFLKYIKVSKLDAAKRLSKHIQLQWSQKLLKVAG